MSKVASLTLIVVFVIFVIQLLLLVLILSIPKRSIDDIMLINDERDLIKDEQDGKFFIE